MSGIKEVLFGTKLKLLSRRISMQRSAQPMNLP